MTDENKSLDSVSMDDLTNDDAMPNVNENAIAAVTARQAAETETAKADGFDPAIHAVDSEGNPVKTKGGNFAKKRGAKKGAVKSTLAKPSTAEKPAAAGAPQVSSLAAAQTVSGLLERAQMALISDEFEYSEKEREENIGSWEKTFDHYGGLNMTPPQQLILSHFAIVMTRATKPKTKTKLGLMTAWFKDKWSNLRNRKNALPDSRKNNERKVDVRQEERESGAT